MAGKIDQFNEMLAQYKVALSPEAAAKLEQMRKDAANYNADFFFRRWSMGLGLPFTMNAVNPDYWGSSAFRTEDTFVFLGADMGDICTVEVGVNFFFNRLFLGVSFDVSTPMIQYTDSFSEFLGNFVLGNGVYPSNRDTLTP